MIVVVSVFVIMLVVRMLSMLVGCGIMFMIMLVMMMHSIFVICGIVSMVVRGFGMHVVIVQQCLISVWMVVIVWGIVSVRLHGISPPLHERIASGSMPDRR